MEIDGVGVEAVGKHQTPFMEDGDMAGRKRGGDVGLDPMIRGHNCRR